MDHRMGDHHVAMEVSMFAPATTDTCICGAVANDPLHQAPPCAWCGDAAELGAPAPWWFRMWCRFCVWLLLGNKEKE